MRNPKTLPALLLAAFLTALVLTGCIRLVSPANEAPGGSVQEPAVEDPTLALPLGQQQAIKKADSYLSYSSFSRTGLIDQLEFEGFSTSDATFAVDYLSVDWNAQAAAKAESYLNSSSFSAQGLLDQLLYEGFTPEQAAFGVQAVGY